MFRILKSAIELTREEKSPPSSSLARSMWAKTQALCDVTKGD